MSQASAAPSLARNDTLDGLKYAAAAAIVLHHVAGIDAGYHIGEFLVAAAATALFLFFAVSGYLHGSVGGRGGAWQLKRLKRLGIPYAFWSVVYLVWGQRELLHGGPPFLPNPLLVIFFAGAHGILWFLPALLGCAIVADVLVRSARSRRIGLALCLIATLVLVWSGIDAHYVGTLGVVRAPFWLFMYLGGMEVRAIEWRPKSFVNLGLLAAASIMTVGLISMRAARFPAPVFATAEMALWATGALLLLFGASICSWTALARFAWGRDYLIGIYLSHVLWLAGFVALVPTSTMNPVLWIPAAWLFTFTGASLTTWALLSFKLTRPVVL